MVCSVVRNIAFISIRTSWGFVWVENSLTGKVSSKFACNCKSGLNGFD